MPFVRVSYVENQYTDAELPVISQCILDALVAHFQVPEDDYFQVFHVHRKSEFYYNAHYLNVTRTDRLLYLHISLASGRSKEQKRQFYQRLAEQISTQCMISEDDIFVVLHEQKERIGALGEGLPK